MKYKRKVLNNQTSEITIEDNVVIKTVIRPGYEKELVDREVYWLTTLKDTGFVPKLIKVVGNSLYLEYIGPTLSKSNIPKDAEKQLLDIILALEKHNCLYNDWKPENVLVRDSKLYLIDFGWCPKIVQDFTCSRKINSALNSKPSGDRFLNVCEFIRSK
jgi:tRNA A-37 threonylcarbamoyl transferase component Bud32